MYTYDEVKRIGRPFNRKKYKDGWYVTDHRGLDCHETDLSQRIWKNEDLDAKDWIIKPAPAVQYISEQAEKFIKEYENLAICGGDEEQRLNFLGGLFDSYHLGWETKKEMQELKHKLDVKEKHCEIAAHTIKEYEDVINEIKEVLQRDHFMMMEGPELRKRLHKILKGV